MLRVVAECGSSGALCVRPHDPRDAAARRRLARAVAAHRAIDAPGIARVVEARLDGDSARAIFDVDVVADGEEVTARLSRGSKVPFEAAIGLADAYLSALAVAHRTPHPESGEPCCLGAVGWGTFFFDARGRFAIVGLGAPLSYELSPPSPGAFVAPEIGVGAAPSPGADVLGLAMMQRSSLAIVALPEQIRRVFFSLPAAGDLALARWLARANRRIFAGAPSERPGIDEGLEFLRRAWTRLGARPDLPRFEALVAAALARPARRALELGPGAAWFRIDGEPRVEIRGRKALRRMLGALVDSAVRESDRALSVVALFEVGWPGERIRADSRAGRVYVALSTLRRLGLAGVVERFEDGYRISPHVAVSRASS